MISDPADAKSIILSLLGDGHFFQPTGCRPVRKANPTIGWLQYWLKMESHWSAAAPTLLKLRATCSKQEEAFHLELRLRKPKPIFTRRVATVFMIISSR